MIKRTLSQIILTTLLLFVNATIFAQVADDFTDGDFTGSPTWSGDNALFVIDANQLRSNSAGAATYYLSTPSTTAADAQWEFFIDFQFSTSGANFSDVYLMADNADLNLVNNGYFVRIGGTPDEISLYSVVAGTPTMIIDGTDGTINSSTSNPFNIRVTRTITDDWTLDIDDGATGSYITDGTVNDNSVSTSIAFGVFIDQSSAASAVNGHYFDNFNVGSIPVDLTPPTLISATGISFTEVDVVFDEALDPTTSQLVTNYTADGGLLNPTTAIIDGGNPALVHLTFATTFVNGQTYNLTVSNVEDLAANAMTTGADSFLFFVPDTPSFRDVVINELLPDPTPQVGLLDKEYVELHNTTTTKFFDITGWEITDGSSSGTIDTYFLGPGEYVILVSTGNVASFSPLWPNVIGVTSFPSLNNAGETVTLNDASANLIDAVSYDDSWYKDVNKEDGGYSLEQINPLLPCSSENNWRASNDVDGGTPGLVNSVYDSSPDIIAPVLIGIDVLSNVTLLAHFSEEITNPGTFVITPTIAVTAANVSGSNAADVVVTLTTAIDTGVVYSATVSGSDDCSGNLGGGTTSFVLPHTPEAGDLIINEVLFNPLTGGDDFVEIYNNSIRFIDIYGFYLADFDDDTISNPKFIGENFIIGPGEYLICTEDSLSVKSDYLNTISGRIIQTDLPTYANDAGHVYLIMPDDSVSDNFAYDEDMQFSLLSSADGVSLERIDFDRETNDASNWHSAAESEGYATPGFENSQYFPGTITGDMVSIQPEIFSPDEDGIDDVVNISYTMDGPGYVANLTIYDAKGRLIKHLVQNELLAIEGIFTWDGIDNDQLKARIGAYVLVFEIFNTEGTVSAVKKAFVVAGQFGG
jgi:hypothetical protein